MSFVVTHDQMIKEGQSLGENALAPQRAVIVGGNAQIFSPIDDPERMGVGIYVGRPIVFHYPNMSADSRVDRSSVRVMADMALLRYAKCDAAPVKGQANQVKVPINCGDDRGIKIGDTVRLTGRSAVVMALVSDAAVVGEGDNAKTVESKVLILSRNLSIEDRKAEKISVELCLPVHGVEFVDVEVGADVITMPADVKLMTAEYAADGAPTELPVVQAVIHIEYKVWYSGLADKVRVVEDENDIRGIPGDDVAANDLKRAVSLAFANSGGMPVAYIAVADPDSLESWVASLNRVRNDYGIVPCSADPAVLAAVEDLVEHRSRAESGRECVAWFSLPSPSTNVVADASNSEDCEDLLAVVTETSAGKIVEVPTGNARFMKVGVRSGDVLRYGDGDYDEFVVDNVVNEDAIAVQGDIMVSDLPTKIAIWRKLDTDEQAASIADRAASYQNKRIRAVWPNEVRDSLEALAGWHLCAALAGLRSGCVPHRDLTGVQLIGIDYVDTELFNEDQLDMMAECGVWIVMQGDDAVVTRRGLTTADHNDITAFNESVVTNLDSINKVLRDTLGQALHNMPGTKGFRSRIVTKLRSQLNILAGRTTASSGAQLVAGEIDIVRRHVYLEDSLVLNVKLIIPQPAGYGLGLPQMEVHQRVIA